VAENAKAGTNRPGIERSGEIAMSLILDHRRRVAGGRRRAGTVSNAPVIRFLCALVTLFCLAPAAPIRAQQSDSGFTRTAVMVPMRDGVHLNTQIHTPSRASERLPLLLLRTPYGIGELSSAQLTAAMPELAADGYIIVQQDIRGRFKSEGQFVMLRQPRDPKDKKAIDESTDTYDTIEWLLKNVPNNNGRVGLAGTSYGAWLSVMGMLEPHPALKAVVTQASPADMWLGDDFHHNGAFRLSYGFEYVYMMESSKEISNVAAVIDSYDAYEWYLKLGALSNVDAKYFQKRLPTWNDFVDHPDYDAFWKRQGFAPWLNRVTGEHELPGRRPLEPWGLVQRRRAETRSRRFRQQDRGVLSKERDGALPGLSLEGKGRARST
jgi:predicted acyl esterase